MYFQFRRPIQYDIQNFKPRHTQRTIAATVIALLLIGCTRAFAQTSRGLPADPTANRAGESAKPKAKVAATPELPAPTEDVRESIGNVEDLLDEGKYDQAYDLLHLMLTQQQNPPDDAAWLGLGLLLIGDKYADQIHEKATIAREAERGKPGHSRTSALHCYQEAVDLFAHIPRKPIVGRQSKPGTARQKLPKPEQVMARGTYDYRRLECSALMAEGELLLNEGYSQDAEKVLQTALIRATQTHDPYRQAIVQWQIAQAYDDLKAFTKEEAPLESALHYFQAQKNPVGEGLMRLSLANLRRSEGHLDTAKSEVESALIGLRGVRSQAGEALGLRTLAQIQRDQKLYTPALAQSETALKIFREQKSAASIVITLTEIAETYLRQKRYDEARTSLTEAKTLAQENDFLPEQAAVLREFGKLERETGHRTEAKVCFDTASTLYHTLSNSVRETLTREEATEK